MNPSYYNSGDGFRVGDLYYERVDQVVKEAEERRATGITDAADDKFKVAVLGIDPQNSFISPHGSLSVPGALGDLSRTIEWIYSNVGRITKFFISLDTHTIHQVFHPAFWKNKEGKHPAPFTVITNKDITDGVWIPDLPGQKDFEDLVAAMANYTSQLEKTGKYSLTIWPYHTMLGTSGYAVSPALMEAVMFHSIVRKADPSFVIKGANPYTENFSILSPEVTQIDLQGRTRSLGVFNHPLVKTLMSYDRIYVFGQAKSHCVLSTLLSIHKEYGHHADFMKKIFLLEDAMSCIPAPPLEQLPPALDFPKVTEEAFTMFAKAGMRRVSTKEPKE